MRSSAGKIEVVAPSSAPMLVIVALPVALIVRAPGPIYSTMALVPPETVSCAGDVEDDVLGRRPAAHAAGQVNRDVLRVEHLPGQPGDDLDRVGAADADGAGAEAAGVRRVRVGADDQLAGEGVLLQHHLVDDAGARPPEARRRTWRPRSAGSRRPPCSRPATRADPTAPSTRAWIRWSQWIVVGTATLSRRVCMNCSTRSGRARPGRPRGRDGASR